MIGLGEYISEAVARRSTGKYADIKEIEAMTEFTDIDKMTEILNSCATFYNGSDNMSEREILKKLPGISKGKRLSYTIVKSRTWIDIFVYDSKKEKAFKLTFETFKGTIIAVVFFVYYGEMFLMTDLYDGRITPDGVEAAKKMLLDAVK